MNRVTALGWHDPNGGRCWALATGLKASGYTTTHCITDVPGILGKYRDLKRQYQSKMAETDYIFVPFEGHFVMPLAWWLGKRTKKKVIYDLFLSQYDSHVYDRKDVPKWHPKAWLLWCIDWLSCTLADICLIDTPEHADYVRETFGINRGKLLALPIGCRNDIFIPQPSAPKEATFTVEFHGTFIPLQGIDTILNAAKLLQDQGEEVQFDIIGKGQTLTAMQKLARDLELTNVDFLGLLPMKELPAKMSRAHVCLGIFGTTAKALRVVPNKAYEILACGCPLITEGSPAARRLLTHGQHALLTEPGNAQSLADAIVQLQTDSNLREKIAVEGRTLFLEKCQPETIVKPLVHWLRAQADG